MSESPSTAIPGSPAGGREEALTPQAIDTILAEFRAWLEQAVQPVPPADAPAAQPVDLHTLVGQFIGLRHEINLQTRATRSQQEQNAATLEELREALEVLENAQAAPAPVETTSDETVRSLLKALVDARDALALAEPEVRRLRETLRPALDAANRQIPPAPPREWFLRRLFKPRAAAARAAAGSVEPAEAVRIRRLLESLLTGYTMSLQRLDRTFQHVELEPIPCIGRPFDAEQMEAVAVVPESGRPAGEVIEEIRRGYLWHGRLFRFAQVSVAAADS